MLLVGPEENVSTGYCMASSALKLKFHFKPPKEMVHVGLLSLILDLSSPIILHGGSGVLELWHRYNYSPQPLNLIMVPSF